MKKIVLPLVVVSLLLVGCGGKKEENSVEQQTQKVETKKSETLKKTTNSAKIQEDVATSPMKKEQSAQSSASAKELFNKCASCHGPDGKRKALGKSGVIAGMKKEEILKKLRGYKSGTLNLYGMGALMKTQVGGLSDKELEALAGYIASIK